MATALIIAFILGYEHTVYQCFNHHLQESFGPITLYMSVYMLTSFHVINNVLPLFQEGQLSVTGESMCTKYWLTA